MANRPQDIADGIYQTAGRSARDFLHEVAEGHIPGHSSVFVFGSNDNISANTTETIWGGSGTYVPPSGAAKVNFGSTNAADAAAGLGARTILVTGLDSNYEVIRETITLNGTSLVLSTKSYIAINEMLVLSAGSSGCNVGIIRANQDVGSLMLNAISPTQSITNSLLTTIPAGYEGHIVKFSCSSSKVSGGTAPKVIFVGRQYNPANGVKYTGFQQTLDTDIIQSIEVDNGLPYIVPEKCTVFMNATTDQNNTSVYGYLSLTVDIQGDEM